MEVGDFELADGVHGRRHADAVQLGIAIVGSVQQKVVGVLARSVDADGEGAADRSRRALRRRHDPWQQQAELVEIAPIERQAENLPVVDYAAHGRRFRPHQRRRSGHVDGYLSRRGQADLHVNILVLVYLHRSTSGRM